MLLRLALLLAVLALVPAGQASAHPHVFVDNHVTFLFGAGGLEGFQLSWLFDDMFGSAIIQDYDRDHDGRFDSRETAVLKAEVFDYLKNSHWFTFVEVDGAPRETREVHGFAARIVQGRLLYEFVVPCAVPATGGERRVLVSVHDPSYYADVQTPEGYVPDMVGAEPFGARATAGLNPDRTYSSYRAWLPEVLLVFRGS